MTGYEGDLLKQATQAMMAKYAGPHIFSFFMWQSIYTRTGRCSGLPLPHHPPTPKEFFRRACWAGDHRFEGIHNCLGGIYKCFHSPASAAVVPSSFVLHNLLLPKVGMMMTRVPVVIGLSFIERGGMR